MKQGEMGEIIYKYRTEKKLTQKQLAEMIGVTNKAVSKWERGEGFPDVTLLPTLAKALDISIDALFNVSQEEEKKSDDSIAKQQETSTQETLSEEKRTFLQRLKLSRSDLLKAICIYCITLAIAYAIELILWHLGIVYFYRDLVEIDFLVVTGILAYKYCKNKHL